MTTQNNTTINEKTKIPLSIVWGIVIFTFLFSGAYFDVKHGISNIETTLKNAAQEDLKTRDFNQYILEAQILNKSNNVIFPDVRNTIRWNGN